MTLDKSKWKPDLAQPQQQDVTSGPRMGASALEKLDLGLLWREK